MTAKAFKEKNPLIEVLQTRGIELKRTGTGFNAKCPFHEDKSPSFSVSLDNGGVWNCHAGCGGGDVISFLARTEGISDADFVKRLPKDDTRPAPSNKGESEPRLEIDKIYSYRDANGEEVYQVVRCKPKTFRQRHQVNGKWVWSMNGVERVLYRAPEVRTAARVWIVEGEKDADSLTALGHVATCNVGGASKWLDSYTDFLAGKEIVLCGDNDEPGRNHIETVIKSIAGKVKSTRRIQLPSEVKDVSDFIATFPSQEAAKAALDGLLINAPETFKGIDLPIYPMWELEERYIDHLRNLKANTLDLGQWLPSLGKQVRGLAPGDLVTILAATGVGKTALLQNIAKAAAPLPTILFELELPETLLFERFIGMQLNRTGDRVEQDYREAIDQEPGFGKEGLTPLAHIFVCPVSRMSIERLEELIRHAELRLGEKPKVVLLDYIQLMRMTGGSRYEQMSRIAEELKIVAKTTGTIVIVASQIARNERDTPEVTLHDAKDSGSIENSSGLVIGAWRDAKEKQKLLLKILKNTRGTSGAIIPCQFSPSMRISEF